MIKFQKYFFVFNASIMKNGYTGTSQTNDSVLHITKKRKLQKSIQNS